MLTNLHVKNLALIEEAEVEFGPGLNILTGETGAGKSILIGSISMILGKKASRDMIRKGADSALIELVFDTSQSKIKQLLSDMDIDADTDQLILTRKLSQNRNVSRINGETCTAAQLRRVASCLLDLHGQHEGQSLLYPEYQMKIVDSFGQTEIMSAKQRVREIYKEWHAKRQELESMTLDETARRREVTFLEYELGEIRGAELSPGEDETLEQEFRKMNNARSLAETVSHIYSLSGYDSSQGAGEMVGQAVHELGRIVSLDPDLGTLYETLNDIDGLLNDFNRELSDYADSLQFSEEDYRETENRLNLINSLKVKYGRTISEILHHADEAERRLNLLQHFDEQRDALTQQVKQSQMQLEKACAQLSQLRKRYAKELTVQVVEGLQDLNFLSVEFEICFKRTASYTEEGYDEAEFLISTNPGEEMKPLSAVVSGGELSRIMLVLKTILADRDEKETLIFDEIDTGISGRCAQKVAEKMMQVGERRQVLCITHLPQIAAASDYHFEITKSVKEGETVTRIRALDEEASVRELARMLGGVRITDSVISNAREMKLLALQQKLTRNIKVS